MSTESKLSLEERHVLSIIELAIRRARNRIQKKQAKGSDYHEMFDILADELGAVIKEYNK